MPNNSINNKRIAKNTLMLYIRMFLTMGITLFTSRVVLQVLGVEDFGIYNVVGGIVSMLGFLNGAMANAVQRFLSFEIGRGDALKVNHVFNVSLVAHLCISIFVLIVAEFAGVWYLNTYINIPTERLSAAHWVLQCAIISTCFNIVQVPYNAIIIAKEEMGVYAYVSIIEVVLKLLIAYLLLAFSFDKLILYSVLNTVVTILVLAIYNVYCNKKFTEVKLRLVHDGKLLKEIIDFAGWNMLGELAWVFTGQGVNIILNLFFGPVVNAAKGIAEQVNGAVSRFVTNFQTALNPQLVKSFAANEIDDMIVLLYRGIRFSYYLLFMLSLPLIINMDLILNIWLTEVPEYATGFCQLVLISSLTATVSNLLSQVAKAYGKIRNYQIIVSVCLFMNFPLSYLVLKLGASPLSTMFVNIAIQLSLIFIRLVLTKSMITLSIRSFFKHVICPVFSVSLTSSIIPLICFWSISNIWVNFIVTSIVAVICVCLSALFVGMERNERTYVITKVKDIILKIPAK